MLVTALIVARALVLGEDPGLAANLAEPWGMVLTLLWLVAAVGWAAWRYWLRPTTTNEGRSASAPPAPDGQDASIPGDSPPAINWYGGPVQIALLATVALVFVSAELAASYKFPARLIAWEWFGLFVSFFVVRQLAVTQAEQHGLFTVVLASAVALAAQGIYQASIELPQNRQLAENTEEFRAKWAEENPGQDVSETFLQQLRQRAFENNIFGPYAHPNSYAGLLILCLPGLIGAVVVCHHMKDTPGRIVARRTVLTALCALLGLAALWFTHSRGAILSLAAAGVGIGLFVYRHQWRARAVPVLIGLIVLVGLVYSGWRSGLLTTGIGKSSNTVAQRLEYWRATWQIIAERPWLGVGPGNFGEYYTRMMPADSEEKIKDPHNFALEMWATSGIFAMLALLAALAALFYQVMRRLGGWVFEESSTQASNDPTTQPPDVRWEFYLGGMFGLLLGFVLRVNTATPGNIMSETYSAAVRSVVWFAAFALLERLAWTARGRVLALTTGIIALLLNLCVSGGIGFPSLAGPLWVAIALALNAAVLRPVSWLSQSGAAVILPLPLFLGVTLGYGVYILYPVLASDGLMREAVQAVVYVQSEGRKPPSERSRGVRINPKAFLKKGVIERLEQAARLTPEDARIYVQLAWGTYQVWESNLQKSSQELPTAKEALRYGDRAAQLDPHGAGGYLVQYQIRTRFAKINEDDAERVRKEHGDPILINDREQTARKQYKLAAEKLEDYLPNDPHDAVLHYMMWRAWHKAGDNEKARTYAAKALELDSLVTAPARKLEDSQRKELESELKLATPAAPQAGDSAPKK